MATGERRGGMTPSEAESASATVLAAMESARALAAAGDALAALNRLWPVLDSDGAAARILAARLLARTVAPVDPVHAPRLQALLTDPAIDPIPVARVGWDLLEAAERLPSPDEAGARAAEADPLILTLLAEACVAHPLAERALTGLRRWLLLSGRAADFPALVLALTAQASHNGGAWPFDVEERAQLDQTPEPLAAAYRPPRPRVMAAEMSGPATARAVAEQYEAWPYPVWQRVMSPEGATLADLFDGLGLDRTALPTEPDILVAGCGTGRETLLIAQRAPGARIIAIDVSAASLAYAADRCRGAGVDFRRHDLHRASELGRFDLISCSGVLHHLADPEAGWAALVDALRPGGVMSVMLYSRLARMRVHAARRRIADLLDRPVDDDLLREARGRLLVDPPHALTWSPDFASMGGTHDLLLHRHEDPFDVPRIRRAIETLGLELLCFQLPGGARRARYRAENPGDPWFRDYDAWALAEWREPELFAGMYRFWCRRPAA